MRRLLRAQIHVQRTHNKKARENRCYSRALSCLASSLSFSASRRCTADGHEGSRGCKCWSRLSRHQAWKASSCLSLSDTFTTTPHKRLLGQSVLLTSAPTTPTRTTTQPRLKPLTRRQGLSPVSSGLRRLRDLNLEEGALNTTPTLRHSISVSPLLPFRVDPRVGSVSKLANENCKINKLLLSTEQPPSERATNPHGVGCFLGQ